MLTRKSALDKVDTTSTNTEVKKMNKLSKAQVVSDLLNYLATGKIASVSFEKKDGSMRDATIQLWRESALSSGDRNIVQENTTSHNPDIITAIDVNIDRWIKFSVERLKRVKFGGEEYML